MNDLFSKKLIIISGKGGCGKSTLSSSIGLAAANKGKKVCIVESSINDRISGFFNQPKAGHNEIQIAPNLYLVNISSQFVVRDYVHHMFGGREFIHRRMFENKIIYSIINTIPFTNEILILGRIYWMLESKRPKNYQKYDMIIYDAPSTGYGLSTLKTPETVRNALGKGIFKDQVEKIITLLSNTHKTSIHLVTIPKPLPISETLESLETIQTQGIYRIESLFINQYWKNPFEKIDQTKLKRAFKSVPQHKAHYSDYLQYCMDFFQFHKEWAEEWLTPLKNQKDLKLFYIPMLLKDTPGDLITSIAAIIENQCRNDE